MKNQTTSPHLHTLSLVISYLDYDNSFLLIFLLPLCSPPICSCHSSSQNLPKIPCHREDKVFIMSHDVPCSSTHLICLAQFSHVSLLAALHTCLALFYHSPIALAATSIFPDICRVHCLASFRSLPYITLSESPSVTELYERPCPSLSFLLIPFYFSP